MIRSLTLKARSHDSYVNDKTCTQRMGCIVTSGVNHMDTCNGGVFYFYNFVEFIEFYDFIWGCVWNKIINDQ